MFRKLFETLCEKDTTEVCRGTVSKELLKEYQDGQKQVHEAYEAWNETKKSVGKRFMPSWESTRMGITPLTHLPGRLWKKSQLTV